MTRKEAIEILKAYRDKLSNSASNQLDKDIKAFNVAINSLEIDERYELEHENAEEIHKGRWIKISPADIYECSTCGPKFDDAGHKSI